jgi:hypothetical protein
MKGLILALCTVLGTATPVSATFLQGQVNEYSSGIEDHQQQIPIAPDRNYPLQAEQASVGKVNFRLNSSRFNLQVDHGEELWGCLGCRVNFCSGVVEVVFRESEAYKLGIIAGDRIIACEGREYSGETLRRLCRGVPGTPIYLSWLDPWGNPHSMAIPRTDGRLLSNHDDYYQELAHACRTW